MFAERARNCRRAAWLLLCVTAALVAIYPDAAHADHATTTARAVGIALGAGHSCAVTDQAGVRCWGWNQDGQLGEGANASHRVPVDVAGLNTPIAEVTAGYNHTCALTNEGAVRCWGANPNGQLGAETTDRCGPFACSRVPVDVTGLSGVASIAAGFAHTCAVTAQGALKCWGFNLQGQLGDGTTRDRSSPGDVAGLSEGVAAVAPGDVQTCALMADGTVKCWGNNLAGELGNGSRTASLMPVSVCRDASCAQPLGDIVQVTSGDYHSCALNVSGNVFCWGSNALGQLGVALAEQCPDAGHPCSTVPLPVTGFAARVTAITAATASSCALMENGAVDCWGQAFSSATSWASPTEISGWQSGITTIAAAFDHACAVTNEGEVLCFGKNMYGQLGDGSNVVRDSAFPPRVWLLSARGDADCDTSVSSLDAFFVLELVAGLIPGLPCPNASPAIGQEISSSDALLILQLGAGLLE